VPWLKRLVAGFPPRRPGFDPRSGHVGFVVDKVALGQVFSEYFGFPCQHPIHQLPHNHHLSSGAGTIGQILADVPSGLSLTLPRETKKKNVHSDLPVLRFELGTSRIRVISVLTCSVRSVTFGTGNRKIMQGRDTCYVSVWPRGYI
jgi:hypothetical protein